MSTRDDPNDIRPVPGHEGYFAGADGAVYSNRQGGRMKPLSVSIVKGYPSTSIMVPGKKTSVRFYVHLLVCAAFHGPRPSPGHQARHLDSDPLNRRQSNLAWGLQADQMEDRRASGRGFGGPGCPRPAPSKRGRGAGKTGVPPTELRPIPGFDGYLASPDGRIFSQKCYPPIELSLNDDGYGYMRVSLSSVLGKKMVTMRVSILICLAYHGQKPSPEHEVLHKDNTPGNSSESNLRWGTKAENMEDRRLARTLAGERNGRAALTDGQAGEAAALVAAGSRHSDVGRRFGVHANTARRLHRRADASELPAVDPIPAPPQDRAAGERHGMAKLTEERARGVILAVHSGRSFKDVSAEFGIDDGSVGRIWSGKLWPHLRSYRASLGPAARRATGRRPERSRTARLTPEQAAEVRRLALSGELRQPEIGRRYGISQAQVSSIKLGKAWAA